MCSDDIRAKFPTLILMAEKKDSIVNGHINIDHTPNKHVIDVYIYQNNESPNDEHDTIFKKPARIPTKDQLELLLP